MRIVLSEHQFGPSGTFFLGAGPWQGLSDQAYQLIVFAHFFQHRVHHVIYTFWVGHLKIREGLCETSQSLSLCVVCCVIEYLLTGWANGAAVYEPS